MDYISKKALEHLSGKIVRKDLTALLKRGANVPTYVLEYLLGMYCATDDETIIESGIKKIRTILSENYVHPEESEKIKSYIREKGEYTIIDKITAELNEQYDCYAAQFSNLNIGPFVLPEEFAVNYTKILMGGIWCMVKIAYVYPEDSGDSNKKGKYKRSNPHDSAFKILSLKPIQLPNMDTEEITGVRKFFSAEEWTKLLLRSTGIESTELNEKERFHLIERIVPLVERNYNLCELGPRGTGKSHIYKEVSPYSILMSGGHTTTSNLFYNMKSSRIGLVGYWDCVAFDEVAGMRFRDMDAIQIMKDYMASGSFARGREMINAEASMVFVGNTNDSVENILKISHLFEPFPTEFNNDSAFFDRMHYYLPGWEVPKIRASYLTKEYGLITDCLAEFCKEMRKVDFTHVFDKWFKLNGDITTRDEIAIRKTVSGLVKLLYPDLNFEIGDLELILTYAIEGRRRVKEQLRRMSGEEFADVNLGYITNDGREVIVFLPEQSVETLIPSGSLLPGHVFAIGRNVGDGNPTIYRLETKTIRGTGKMEIQGLRGSGSRAAKESITAAWYYFQEHGQQVKRTTGFSNLDYLIYYGNPQNRDISAEVSIAEFIGICSATYMVPLLQSMAIVGELTLSGTVNQIKGLSDYVRVACNAGAKFILIPSKSKDDFESIQDAELKKVIPLYYDDPIHAARKALGLDE